MQPTGNSGLIKACFVFCWMLSTLVQSELIVEHAELILEVFELTVVERQLTSDESDFGAKSRILFRSDQSDIILASEPGSPKLNLRPHKLFLCRG